MNDAALLRLVDRVLAARAARTPLRLQGAGSKDFYGEALQGEVLSTHELRGILSYEPSELVVRVAAGTPLAELEAALAEQGQMLPFEPPHFGADATGGTCGGMVAAGLSGPARASAGSVRDHVLGVRLINGRGELLRFGGEVMKNVAGYDVSRLMVGAWGTLGLLTDIAIKVLPCAPAQATLRFELNQAKALTHLHGWLAQPLPINASCWVRDDTTPTQPQCLYVRLRGAVAAVEEACTRLLADAPGQRLGPETDADWDACRNQRQPFFAPPSPELALWRLSLPQTTPALAPISAKDNKLDPRASSRERDVRGR